LWGLAYEGLPVADWTNVVILGAFGAAFGYFYSRA
jgi:hypothetical protein